MHGGVPGKGDTVSKVLHRSNGSGGALVNLNLQYMHTGTRYPITKLNMYGISKWHVKSHKM